MTGLVRERNPGADSLLDVACGTGGHLEFFQDSFSDVAGLELSEPMRERAEKRLPHLSIHAGDMRGFALRRGFDAVCCLFCSVGHMESRSELDSSVRCMAAHLNPGGVLVVEPWWFPETFIDGYLSGHVAQEPGRTVARVSRSVRRGDATHMEVRFVVADRSGIRDFTSVTALSLFTREQYAAAFEAAGCAVEYVESGWEGSGLFVGVRR